MLKKLNPSPVHVAIICDGNRRWAKSQGMAVVMGHKVASEKTFEPLVQKAIELNIKYLTFWVFSTENWNRSQLEIEAIFTIFRSQFHTILPKCHQHHIRIKTIGDISRLPSDLQEFIHQAVDETKNFQQLTLVFAINYGGRDELTRAMSNLLHERLQSRTSNGLVTSAEVEKYLDTAELPDPDMIIRTSGEYRLSGFMPWQSTYSELFFIQENFPEFTPQKLEELVEEYQRRQRRFGR